MAVWHRHVATVTIVLLVALLGAAAALALSAAPALAFDQWQHDGASTCASCHGAGSPTDAACTTCHFRFTSFPGDTCWSCHAPGTDTSTLSSPSSACLQDCHLYYPPAKDYVISYTHGPEPHLGAVGWGFECLDCHTTSTLGSVNGSPHHTGQTTPAPTCEDCHDGSIPGITAQVTHDGVACTGCHTGMNIPPVPSTCWGCHAQKTFGSANCATCHASMIHNLKPSVTGCTTCHSGYRKHAGSVACTRCHTNAAAFHHGTQKMTAKRCGACHSKTHARRSVPTSRCGQCHQGNAPAAKPRVQHSSRITRKSVCSGCHSQRLHASSRGARLTCRSCHTSRFHARQPRPGNSVCLRCHSSARNHSIRFSCSVCHRPAIHSPDPNRLPR